VPFLSKLIVDDIVLHYTDNQGDIRRIVIILIFIILTDILISVMTAFGQWISGDILTVKLNSFLTEKFYKHILDLHIGYFDNNTTGNIVNKMYRGITSITEFIKNMLNNFLPFFLSAIVTIAILAFYSPLIAILLTVLFPVYIFISHKSTLNWEKHETVKNEINDIAQSRVFESIAGIRVVKAFVQEITEMSKYLNSRKKIVDITIKQTKEWHLYDFYRRIFLNFILFFIYAYIVYQTYRKIYSIGEMTLLLQLANQARFPLFAMSFILGQIQMANAGSRDFFKIMEIKNEIKDKDSANKLVINNLKKNIPLIKFSNVYFSYNNSDTVLKNINFEIYPGQKIALVGESGQGKTTLINLILKYYLPNKGKIFINTQDILEIQSDSLRNYIAVVFQDNLLFSGTIMENIKYSNPSATDADAMNAAQAANAKEFIDKFDNKYDTYIGERGIKLSGGQKQRIAIARAILSNASIIILDEATSSLDSKSELLVQKGIERLLKNRTSIIIAHRLSTISDADKIIVLADKTIKQFGTRAELMQDKKGIFYQLSDLQRQLTHLPSEDKKNKLRKFDLYTE
jgi:ATP-binding cassette subfamily B protein